MTPLCEIANKFHCDKGPEHHNYTPVYHRYFEKFRNDPLTILELGFGGYEYPDRGGAGALMWTDYFHNAQIVTTDIHQKNSLGHERIDFLKVAQDDPAFIDYYRALEFDSPKIIIDDASHISALTIKSFEILFPLLTMGGIYVIEDTHASYWKDHGFNGSVHLDDLRSVSTMNYFKLLVDSVNYQHVEGLKEIYPYLRNDIESIHFYKQLIFVFKKA